ncbi:hypothetical protein [Candidatus Avelusimicrobium fimicolum]|jgi:hypothetical protein|uniref:hypothetical protein n=1 Tax=Candidatus Avelusimicrobium fimicolum TaxID=3416216 RepID=UPI003D0F4BA7
MKVPQYENRVAPGSITAARPQAVTPVAGAFGESVAAAGKNVAQGIDRMAAAMDNAANRLAVRQRNLRTTAAILNWRKDNDELLNGKLGDDGKRIDGGLLSKEYGQADTIAADYQTKGQELMKKYLDMAPTDDEREELALEFQKDFQNNFDTVARYQLKQQRAQGDLLTDAYKKQQAGLAGAITTVAGMRANLDDTYKKSNENATAAGVPPQAQALLRFDIARDNVSAAVKGSIINGNLSAARQVLDGVKDDLLPDDYNQLNNFIKKAEQTQVQGTKSERLGPLYERALLMAETEPEKLQEEIVGLMRNPASALTQYSQNFGPLDAKGLLEYGKWVQNNLLDSPDTRSGRIKQANWQAHESGFNAFEWKIKSGKDPKIGNKDMNNPQTVLAAIGALSGQIAHHDFDGEDLKKAEKQLSQLRQALGTMDIKANDTALGEIVRQANLLSDGAEKRAETGTTTRLAPLEVEGISLLNDREVKNYENYPVGGFLTPEEKSLIIEQAAQFLQAANVNLLAEDTNTRTQAVAAVQTVARDYVRSKFAINRDDVMDVQVGENTFKSYGIKPNPRLGADVKSRLDGYRYQEENGAAYLIKRDKNNKELHRQLL